MNDKYSPMVTRDIRRELREGNWTVRRFSPDEVELDDLFKLTYKGGGMSQVLRGEASPECPLWGAFCAGRIVGWAVVFHESDGKTEGPLVAAFVWSRWRGKGLGSSLLDGVIRDYVAENPEVDTLFYSAKSEHGGVVKLAIEKQGLQAVPMQV